MWRIEHVMSNYPQPFSTTRPQVDGLSYNTLIGRTAALPGPTLLLLKTKTGFIAGGMGPEPWRKEGSFFGDSSTCVFSLHPTLQVFRLLKLFEEAHAQTL